MITYLFEVSFILATGLVTGYLLQRREMKEKQINLLKMIKEIKIKMWNWRGNQSTSIDKIAMEKILNEVIDKYTDKEDT